MAASTVLSEEGQVLWRTRLRSMSPSACDIFLRQDPENGASQGEEWAEVLVEGQWRSINFHDYPAIFSIPGLYERLFYERLQCQSPHQVATLLKALVDSGEVGPAMPDLRVLDVGAGNGMVGDELRALGAGLVYGVDVIEEARAATERDRPGVYDGYLVADLTGLGPEQEAVLRAHRFNCLTMVAALGVRQPLTGVLRKAIELVSVSGLIAFTVRVDLLAPGHWGGLSDLVQSLEQTGILETHMYRRYRHRLLATGEPVYYAAIIARKVKDAA